MTIAPLFNVAGAAVLCGFLLMGFLELMQWVGYYRWHWAAQLAFLTGACLLGAVLSFYLQRIGEAVR